MADTLLVLGASGDMARRLLFPALYQLEVDGRLDGLKVIGYALEDWDADHFRDEVRSGCADLAQLTLDDAVMQRFLARLDYHRGDLSPDSLKALVPELSENVAFYLALPPAVFTPAAAALAAAGLNASASGWRRLVIEKPFGIDLDSAIQLNAALHQNWSEEQIFRIDHYLGKETVQNILVFRFGNRILDPLLNTNQVESVQITAAETLGLEGRYRYYDGIGALRDMLQSHLMQLLALTAMEPPSLWDAEIIHDHKAEALHSVRPLRPEDVAEQAVRGQYTAGTSDGAIVTGYTEEPGIAPGSRTETFAALRLYVDNWRWNGVPFYLRSGKRLAAGLTEVAIQFREPPMRLFQGTEMDARVNNSLVFRLRPAESINLSVQAREPGLELVSRPLTLHADYAAGRDNDSSSYQQLLLDVLEGDKTPFLRFDEVEWAWRILQPVLDVWATGEPDLYRAGSQGPNTQQRILRPGHAWRPLSAIEPAQA